MSEPITTEESGRPNGRGIGGHSLADTLQRIYNAEINVKIETLWDGGYDVAIGGDYMTGWRYEGIVESAWEIEPFLRQAFFRHFQTPQGATPPSTPETSS